MGALLKKPSAWVPLAFSFAILAMLVGFLTGVFHETTDGDEGAGAHLFQLWLVVELVLIPFFAFRWLQHFPKETLTILALQITVALVPVTVVFLLQW